MSTLSWTLLASEFPDTMHDVRDTYYCIILLIQVLHKYISLHVMISSESSRKHSNINLIMLEEKFNNFHFNPFLSCDIIWFDCIYLSHIQLGWNWICNSNVQVYVYAGLQITKYNVWCVYIIFVDIKMHKEQELDVFQLITLLLFRKVEFPIDVDMTILWDGKTILWDGKRPVRVTSL